MSVDLRPGSESDGPVVDFNPDSDLRLSIGAVAFGTVLAIACLYLYRTYLPPENLISYKATDYIAIGLGIFGALVALAGASGIVDYAKLKLRQKK